MNRFLAHSEWFKKQVEIGLQQINRGEFVEDEEVRTRVERMFPS